MLQLGSRFVFCVLIQSERPGTPALDVLPQGYAAHVRPGKFMAKARAQFAKRMR